MKAVNGSNGYSLLPEHMQESMMLYITQGVPVGSFLRAVLCNDLAAAAANADEVNQRYLFNYAMFLHNHAPLLCHGSAENYERWIHMQGLINRERGSHNA